MKVLLNHNDPNSDDLITEHSKVAVKKVEAIGSQKEQIYFATNLIRLEF